MQHGFDIMAVSAVALLLDGPLVRAFVFHQIIKIIGWLDFSIIINVRPISHLYLIPELDFEVDR